jgi:outer membrane protein OmpA-like peptidoglycan-associated protein
VDRFVLTPGTGPLVGGDGTTAGQLKFRVGLAFHYERAPLVLTITDGADRTSSEVIGHRFQTHVFGVLGLTDWLDLQVQLPVTLVQAGDDLQRFGLTAPSSIGVGSPVIGARLSLLSTARKGPFDLALQLAVALPLGTPSALTGGRLAFLPSVHASRSFDWLHLAAALGAGIEGATAVGSQRLGSQFELTATLGVGRALRAELTSRSVFSFAGANPTSELLVGGRVMSLEPFDFFVHLGPSFGTAPGTPSFRVLAGVGVGNAYHRAPPDPCLGPNHTPLQCPKLDDDQDTILNAVDRCPLEAEDRDGFQDEDGCVDKDNDGDAIVDAQDSCRDVAGVAEYAGCPIPDEDKDGVLDAVDQCPKEPGLVARKGCPFRDGDSDGLEDAIDSCPTEPGPKELGGCAPKDRDGDEVFDHLDNCPDEKGTKENQGCPAKKKQLVMITAEKLVIKDKVYFATGKSTILPRSFPLLDQVAQVASAHPELTRIVVEGHTDSVGKADKNRVLSQQRADAVLTYLVKKGVAASRLSAKGYGPDRPAETNDTPAGREMNRRVEFTLPSDEKTGGTP